MHAADSIRDLTLPVVLISANGLLCLALYNRLAAVTNRLRSFCRERFEMELHLHQMDEETRAKAAARFLQSRLDTLSSQRASILARAAQLRNSLVLLLAAVVGFLGTSLLIGAADRFALPTLWPVTAFLLGTAAMMSGVMLAIRELWTALDPIRDEDGSAAHDSQDNLPAEYRAPRCLTLPVERGLKSRREQSSFR